MNKKCQDIEKRTRLIKNGKRGTGPVVYWMSREQRVADNYALLYAQQEALLRDKSLTVVFCLNDTKKEQNPRQKNITLTGLCETAATLRQYKIELRCLEGKPPQVLPAFCKDLHCNLLVTDFNPLKNGRQWLAGLEKELIAPIVEVDSHNIIPAWIASEKKEYGAYTIRPKIKRLLADFLVEPPRLQIHPQRLDAEAKDFAAALQLDEDSNAFSPPDWFLPGEKAALAAATTFIGKRLSRYHRDRNDPCQNGQSHLSPYLHFGHIAAQRVALLVKNAAGVSAEAKDVFLEELIVRKELSDNYCYYEPNYDSLQGFPSWAVKTLNDHRDDPRDYLYSLDQLENGQTHEELWNACQKDLVQQGRLHGYLRMYWCKKILEWTRSPEEALDCAIYLNDRYALDGCDPNGYTGIAWSIGGVHDRAWKEREIFGKIRYMNLNGCRRKFSVDQYIASVSQF